MKRELTMDDHVYSVPRKVKQLVIPTGTLCFCPTCNEDIYEVWPEIYCPYCGQCLDWSATIIDQIGKFEPRPR